MSPSFEEVLRARKITHRRFVSTATLCSFRIGGAAATVVEPSCLGELTEAVSLCRQMEKPFAVIGGGTNLLFDDAPINVVLIRTTSLCGVRFLGGGRVKALCGTPLPQLASLCAARGLGGLSFAAGIPGTLGGALFMNAGANGKEMANVVRSVKYYDPTADQITTLFNQELSYSYRNSVFQSNFGVILSAELDLAPMRPCAEIFAEMKALSAKRRASQPLEFPSAGSIFRRPSPAVPLSKLLDGLGLKGKRIGGAAVSEKHAGFIVNLGGATARDVRALILEIQNLVEGECGIRPIPEIRFIPSQQ